MPCYYRPRDHPPKDPRLNTTPSHTPAAGPSRCVAEHAPSQGQVVAGAGPGVEHRLSRADFRVLPAMRALERERIDDIEDDRHQAEEQHEQDHYGGDGDQIPVINPPARDLLVKRHGEVPAVQRGTGARC